MSRVAVANHVKLSWLLIRGAVPGSNGDYVVIRESKKRPKGWKPHAQRPENIKKAEAKKK